MRKHLVLGALALALTACDGPTHVLGNLDIFAKVRIVPTSGGETYLSPGRFPASVSTDQNAGTIAIETAGGELSFQIPASAVGQDGKIDIPGGEIGQSFDLRGEISTIRKPFDRYARKPCIHHYEDPYQCFQPPGTVDCNWAQVPVYGNHDVHEEGYQDTKRVVAHMVRGKVVGSFTGQYQYPEVVTSSKVESGCRM